MKYHSVHKHEKFKTSFKRIRRESEEKNLTDQEKEVLNKLSDAWNAYCSLDNERENHKDEFHYGIHTLQRIIAFRVAKRIDPDFWR